MLAKALVRKADLGPLKRRWVDSGGVEKLVSGRANEGTGAVEIAGVIDNPIGSTIITSKGAILSGGGTIRTNTLSLTAAGDAGSLSSRLGVDLVKSPDLPTDLTISAAACASACRRSQPGVRARAASAP